MAALSTSERDSIKNWVESLVLANPSIVRKMQDDWVTIDTGDNKAAHEFLNGMRSGDTPTFRRRVEAFKAHVTLQGYQDGALFQCLTYPRPSCFIEESDVEKVLAAANRRFAKKDSSGALCRAMTEAQTGFFGTTEEELDALKKAPKDHWEGVTDGMDRLNTILSNRPDALAKVKLDTFRHIVEEVLKANSLLLSKEAQAVIKKLTGYGLLYDEDARRKLGAPNMPEASAISDIPTPVVVPVPPIMQVQPPTMVQPPAPIAPTLKAIEPPATPALVAAKPALTVTLQAPPKSDEDRIREWIRKWTSPDVVMHMQGICEESIIGNLGYSTPYANRLMDEVLAHKRSLEKGYYLNGSPSFMKPQLLQRIRRSCMTGEMQPPLPDSTVDGSNAPNHPNGALFRGLVEAQTGFRNITEEEFNALAHNKLTNGVSLRDEPEISGAAWWMNVFRDQYHSIYDTIPRDALERVGFDRFRSITADVVNNELRHAIIPSARDELSSLAAKVAASRTTPSGIALPRSSP